MDDGKPKRLDQLHQQIRARNYSIRTETVYAEWAKRHIRFHLYRHTAEMGPAEIEAFSPILRSHDVAVIAALDCPVGKELPLAALSDEP